VKTGKLHPGVGTVRWSLG